MKSSDYIFLLFQDEEMNRENRKEGRIREIAAEKHFSR